MLGSARTSPRCSTDRRRAAGCRSTRRATWPSRGSGGRWPPDGGPDATTETRSARNRTRSAKRHEHECFGLPSDHWLCYTQPRRGCSGLRERGGLMGSKTLADLQDLVRGEVVTPEDDGYED